MSERVNHVEDFGVEGREETKTQLGKREDQEKCFLFCFRRRRLACLQIDGEKCPEREMNERIQKEEKIAEWDSEGGLREQVRGQLWTGDGTAFPWS